MSDLVLDNITNPTRVSVMNDNFEKIEDKVNEDVLQNKDGHNTMLQDLDMDSNQILNLPKAVNDTDPVRLIDLEKITGLGPYTIPVSNGGTGATTASGARANLGVDSSSEVDAKVAVVDAKAEKNKQDIALIKEIDGVGESFQTRQAVEALYKAQGYNNVFFFEDGFTYTASNDVGVYEDGTAWTYVGALPVTVAAGTVPSEGTYAKVRQPYTFGQSEFTANNSTTPRDLNERASDIINALDYGLTNDGVDCTSANNNMVNNNAGRSIYYPDGEYNIAEYPSGIDDVHLTGSPRIVWTDKKMPIASRVFAGGQDIAIVSGVLRYYRAGFSPEVTEDGWYMLQDAGQNHYSVLMGPVRASGSISTVVDLQIEDFGLNRSEWTPSGFVCGADETYAAQGITFGASVRTDFLTINATGNLPRSGYVKYDGTYPSGSFSMSGMSGLSFEWVQGTAPNAYLKITRTGDKRLGYSANSYSDLTITARAETGSGLVMSNPDLQSGSEYRYRFFSAPEGMGFSEIQDPTGLQFYITDRGQSPELWNFSNPEGLGAAEGGSGNIWCVGVFTKRYPNE